MLALWKRIAGLSDSSLLRAALEDNMALAGSAGTGWFCDVASFVERVGCVPQGEVSSDGKEVSVMQLGRESGLGRHTKNVKAPRGILEGVQEVRKYVEQLAAIMLCALNLRPGCGPLQNCAFSQ